MPKIQPKTHTQITHLTRKMKCFAVVLLAVLAIAQSRTVLLDEQDIVLHGVGDKEILITKPNGELGHRFIHIFGNGYFPDKIIDIDADETTYPRGKRSSDVFAEIFSGLTGTLDVDTYRTLLKKVEKAVEKGEISSYLYDLLVKYDLFTPTYEKDTKFFGQQPFYGQYPTGKYFGSEYPRFGQYGQFFGGFPYNKYTPYHYGKYFGGEQQYYGPYNYYKQVPYKYEAGYLPSKHQVVENKYETEYNVPRKYESEYYVPEQYETQYYGQYNAYKQVPYKYEAEYVPSKQQLLEKTVPHKYETEYNVPYKYETELNVPQQYQGQFYGPYSQESQYYPFHYGTQYYGANKFGYNYGK